MTDRARRKELASQYRQRPAGQGVYVLRNTGSGKGLLGSTASLATVKNKLDFAKVTRTASVLDLRLQPDIAASGIDAFEFEVLDTVDVTPAMTADDVASELATLERLWREKLAGTLY